ncbi:MAG: membrane dipeptidase [Chloroflexi bacterium]|nr:membrane dipeptidase [Chloroflexota bacterium]
MVIVDAQQNIAFNAQQLGLDYTRWAWHQRRDASGADGPPPVVSLRDNMLGRVAIVFGSLQVLSESTPGLQAWQRHTYRTAADARQLALWQMDTYRRLADDHDKVRLILTRDDLDDVLETWRDDESIDKRLHGIVVKMKGAEPVSEPRQLEDWLEYGVRIVAPAWHQTRYAGSARSDGGLTLLGYELLEVMAGFQLLLDVSALSEQATAEALERYEGAIIASHSNPRFFCQSSRCLPDALIRRLAERDGVMGIMVYNRFLRNDWHPADRKRQVNLAHWVDAVDYVCQLTGSVAHVGLDSDIDGGYPYRALPSEIDTSCDLWLLRRSLLERGFSEKESAAILGGNMLRKLKECLPDG